MSLAQEFLALLEVEQAQQEQHQAGDAQHEAVMADDFPPNNVVEVSWGIEGI